jgi:serine/threonine protein kinase
MFSGCPNSNVRGTEIYLSGMKGTPAWMAPEVLTGQPVSVATDVYGLGLVFWEMVTARRPFEGKSVTEVRCLVIKSDDNMSCQHYSKNRLDTLFV